MRITFIILILVSLTNTLIAQDAWSTKASMLTGRWGSGVGNLGGVAYVVGGYASGTHLTTVDAYTPSTNSWIAKPARPSVQTSPAYGVINNILYTAGGTNTSVEISDLWSYIPFTDSWIQLASLPAVRQSACGGVIGGLFYVVGGRVGSISQTSMVVYDPSFNTWTTKPAMPTARYGAASGVINGLFYVAGGKSAENGTTFSTLEVYDPIFNSWTTKAAMPTAISSAAFEVVNGVLYVMGGLNSAGNVVSGVLAYDPLSNTWSTRSPMAFARANAAAVVDNGLMYVSGGYNSASTPVLPVEAYPLETEPTAQPTNVQVTDLQSTTFAYDITAAVGVGGYIHIYKAGSAPTALPLDGFAYVQGDVLPDGSIVQFSDNFPTGNVYSSLTPSTSYFIKIFSYNGAGSTTNYLTTSPLSTTITTSSGSVATEPTAQPINLVFSNPTSTSFDYVFTAATGSPTGYLVLRSSGSAVTGVPLDGTVYLVDDPLGNAFVRATNAVAGTTYTASSLTPSTTYHTAIFAYNGSGSTINYRQVSPLLGNFATASSSLATEPTNSPTNLTFTNITATTYSFSFTAASGPQAPDGYIGVRKSGSAPNGVPVDGMTYSATDPLGDGFVNFVSLGTTFDQTSALPSTSYFLAIYSYRGTGISINYKQLSPLTGFVTTLSDIDSTEPVISLNTTPKLVKAGEAIKVSLTATDPETGITSAEINYGEATSFDWIGVSLPMTNTSGNIWEFTIPANVVKDLGVEYLVTVFNGAGLQTDSNVQGVSIGVDQNGASVPFSAGSSQANYKIISVPYLLEAKTVDKVFGDDLGNYGNKSKWRMFRYSGTKTTELSGSSTINPGEGYWLISSDNATLDSGPGVTVGRVSNPFTISVSKGWNQIGNPYVINLLWAYVKTYTFDALDNNTLGLGNLRSFFAGSWLDGPILKKFEGGFVMATTAGTMIFPAEKQAAAGRTEEKPVVLKQNSIDSQDWEVNFELTNGIQTMDFGGIGMNQKASEGYDAYDDFTLPRFLDYIELNHASKNLFDIAYTKDIVPTSENHTWEFSVESNASGPVTINWDNSFFGNNNKQLVLWDVNLQRGFDMRAQKQYLFSWFRSGHFKVYYGDAQFVKEKTSVDQIVFHDVFPNPAKDMVTISFSVPTEERVTVEVIDLLGRKMATVADGNFKPGYHEVRWNTQDNSGNPLTTGIYITQVKGLHSDHQKRLSITK